MKGGGWIVKLRGKVSGAAYRLLGRLRHRPGRPGRAREGQGVSKEGTLGVPGSLWETLGPLTERGDARLLAKSCCTSAAVFWKG